VSEVSNSAVYSLMSRIQLYYLFKTLDHFVTVLQSVLIGFLDYKIDCKKLFMLLYDFKAEEFVSNFFH
jgi:hypothetical protein